MYNDTKLWKVRFYQEGRNLAKEGKNLDQEGKNLDQEGKNLDQVRQES